MNLPNLTSPICMECNRPKNDRGFCMACYERVVKEKPLERWRQAGSAKYRRWTNSKPIDGNWEKLPF